QIATQHGVIRELQARVAELQGCEIKDFQQLDATSNVPEAVKSQGTAYSPTHGCFLPA
ncbi:unnamed protein product, partial [Symbiodinium microadriaticum]